MMLLALSIMITTHAIDLPGEEVWVSEQRQPTEKTNPPIEMPAKGKVQKKPTSSRDKLPGNLPSDYHQITRESTNSLLLGPPTGSIETSPILKVGEELAAIIHHSVIAFSDERSPVVSVATAPQYRGIKFIGESRLEKNSRRIFIEFKRAIIAGREFQVKATGVSESGQPGLIGKYYSRELEYFTGDFLASFTAGYFDGLVPRRTNAFGEIQSDNSVDSAVKKGLASGSLATAERFREKLKKVPEFSEIKGPFPLQILILEPATNKKQ